MRHIRLDDAVACFALVDECSEIRDDPDAWQEHLCAGLERLIGGCCGTLAVNRVEPQGPKVQEWHVAKANGAGLLGTFDRFVNDGAFRLLPEIDVVSPAIASTGWVAYRQSNVVGRDTYHRSAYYQNYLREHRIEECVIAVHRLGNAAFLGLAVQRLAGERAFTERQEGIIELLAATLAPRTGTELTMTTQLGRHQLAPRLRRTLTVLLEGATERELAARLGISRATAHEYIDQVYRHFGVNTRAQLMALFLRRKPPERGASHR